MSSFVRRIERQVVPSRKVHVRLDLDGEPIINKRGGFTFYANPPRHKFAGKNLFHSGRGARLGITNTKGKDLLARLAREAKRKARK